MELLALVSMEVVVNDRPYRLQGINGAPTADYHDAARQFLAKIEAIGQEQAEKQAELAAEEKAKLDASQAEEVQAELN